MTFRIGSSAESNSGRTRPAGAAISLKIIAEANSVFALLGESLFKLFPMAGYSAESLVALSHDPHRRRAAAGDVPGKYRYFKTRNPMRCMSMVFNSLPSAMTGTRSAMR